MRSFLFTALAGATLAAALSLVACKQSSPAESNDAGDAASGDSGASSAIDSSLGVGDDATTGGADAAIFDDVATGNCTVPDGTYVITMTPSGDAGGPGCVATTSTLTLPISPGDSGLSCTLMPDGMLPVCTLDFWCTQDGAGTTISTNGYIQVVNTSYAGHETVQVVSTMVGMPTLSTCSYTTEYAKQ
jgi:hypothetical protein